MHVRAKPASVHDPANFEQQDHRNGQLLSNRVECSHFRSDPMGLAEGMTGAQQNWLRSASVRDK